MATAKVNGVQLFYEISGSGEVPLVLVHGSWTSLETWRLVIPELTQSFRLLTFDRRGHSASERPGGQGSIHDDVADLAALIEHLGLGPTWVAGNSFGGSITLRLAAEHPQRVHYRSGYDEPFAHRIEAGADLFLMPSRYEPCGLNQMYSLRYGTPPVVRATGGLADTVEDFDPATRRGTGFLFQRYEASEMVAALRRAFTIHRQPHLFAALRENGMAVDFSWRTSADGYDALYEEAFQLAPEPWMIETSKEQRNKLSGLLALSPLALLR